MELTGEENQLANENILEKITELNLLSQSENKRINDVKAFGLNTELGAWRFGYYIGIDYLDDANKIPLQVFPKINLDYWVMFNECLNNTEARKYLSSIFNIHIDKPFVEISSNTRKQVTWLIMYHYLVLLSELVKKPLAKSYINRSENLKSKIKGKVLLGGHIKKNISNKRYDRIMCSFDEYSTDCLANRLLHSAYKICMKHVDDKENEKISFVEFNYIESYFRNIGYTESLMDLPKIKTNPLFLEYKDALRIAKIIIKQKSYDDKSQNKTNFKIPPYIIDMPKLFEIYVLAKLKSAKLDIDYQAGGNYGEVDFIEKTQKIIIDTKYKTIYDSEKQEYKIEDIRQVSGYARDKKILQKLYGDDKKEWENKVPDCLIIYPDMENEDEDFKNKNLLKDTIKQFNKFYKFGIKLPRAKGVK
jgi:5-methylcytosine-specific restriction endonuclease McrBC regulatory subunit McrC